MRPPDTRRGRPAGTPDTLQNDHRHEVTHQGTRGVSQRGATSPTVAFLEGRERVLGRRVVVPLVDPAAAFEVLCEALGGRDLAGDFVRQMLDELLDELPEEMPFDHPDDCDLCGSWRHRLAEVGS